jgi:DNA modification methylase
MGSWTVRNGDCLKVLPTLEANSVDAIVTDPPYGLGFMGKAWDHAVPGPEFFAAMLRVAKPGAHLVAFGGTRLYHRMTVAIEDAGWEVRDCLMWLYGSGFPKSHNGEWGGTALKPAWEPIVLARKPLEGTVAANHLRHGCGGLNVDGCRIETQDDLNGGGYSGGTPKTMFSGLGRLTQDQFKQPYGRWPANLILDAEAGAGEEWSRFFYCPKASKADRDEGLEGFEAKGVHRYGAGIGEGKYPNAPSKDRNTHPTVKPTDLMRYLCRLITPIGGTVLDPFTGSGSTGKAAVAEGFNFIGIEMDEQYAEIARARIAHAAPKDLFAEVG